MDDPWRRQNMCNKDQVYPSGADYSHVLESSVGEGEAEQSHGGKSNSMRK